MLRQMFPRSSEKYRHSTFARELSEFFDWLQQAGYSKDNIRGHLRRLFRVLSRSKKVKPDAVRSRMFLQRAFARYCTTRERSQHFRGTERAYCRFLRSQDRLIEEPPRDAASLLLARYRRYLVEVRGFSERTVPHHQHTIAEFLKTALRSGRNIAALTGEDVERYLEQKSKRLTRHSMQHIVAHLRAFLRYGFSKGLLKKGLDVIDTPRTFRDELPPRALPWDLVKKLLRSLSS